MKTRVMFFSLRGLTTTLIDVEVNAKIERLRKNVLSVDIKQSNFTADVYHVTIVYRED